MTTWDEAHGAATAALAKQKWNKAVGVLAPWLGAIAPDLDAKGWGDAVSMLATAMTGLDGTLASAAAQAAVAPDDGAALHGFGHALVGARRPDLAVAILARANARAPGREPLAELVAALELLGRNREAVEVLDAAPALVAGDALLAYLRAFNAVKVGDVDAARQLLPRLEAATDERDRFMAGRIARMVARHDALVARSPVPLDDVRRWHFITTGGVLLHATRLARTWDTPARVKAGVESLALVVDALGLAPPAVLHPPDRTSELLARVCAATLDRPLQPWYGGDDRGLLVVYDARALIDELRAPLRHHRPGQPLFMQAAEHTTEQPVAPDVLTYLYAHNTSPWGPGLTPDHQPLDTTGIPVDELVRATLDAAPDPELTDREALRAFLADLRELPPEAAPAATRANGQREPLWVGSPAA
jgi:tetratricopeptide (TPR) repeat protein